MLVNYQASTLPQWGVACINMLPNSSTIMGIVLYQLTYFESFNLQLVAFLWIVKIVYSIVFNYVLVRR